MSQKDVPPTSGVLPDALAAMGAGRIVVIDGAVDDDVLLAGEPLGLTRALASAWSGATGAISVVWSPSRGLEPVLSDTRARLAAALGEGVGSSTGAAEEDVLSRRAPLDVSDLLCRLFSQTRERIMVAVEAAELTCPTGQDPGSQRQAAALLAAVEAFERSDELHALVLLSRDPASIAPTVTRRVGVAAVRIAAPTAPERSSVASRAFDRSEKDESIRRITISTEGFRLREIAMLPAHSAAVGIGVEDPRDLTSSFRHGHRVDPWSALTPTRIEEIRKEVRASVFGQERAVADVLRRLDVARSGLELDPPGGATRKSRLELFLVGPTGVGKNELARALARSIFGDTSAVMTFDMSAFQQEHSGERLFGAPPGYVGHDQGSPLVERLRERPFSVIVFDEIEKAHPNNWLRLMAAIDEGRVTDGSGVQASLESAIVIFTSNIGGRGLLKRAKTGDFDTEEVERLVLHLVEAHLSQATYKDPTDGELIEGIGKPEVWGRLANSVVPFDLLREPALEQIVARFCATLAESARRNRGVEARIDVQSILPVIVGELGAPGTWNGRLVRGYIDRLVRQPLAAEFQNPRHADAGVVDVRIDETGRLEFAAGGKRERRFRARA